MQELSEAQVLLLKVSRSQMSIKVQTLARSHMSPDRSTTRTSSDMEAQRRRPTRPLVATCDAISSYMKIMLWVKQKVSVKKQEPRNESSNIRLQSSFITSI